MERKTFYSVMFDLGDSADEAEAEALISNFKDGLSQHNILPAGGQWGDAIDIADECDEYVVYGEDYDRLEEASSVAKEG